MTSQILGRVKRPFGELCLHIVQVIIVMFFVVLSSLVFTVGVHCGDSAHFNNYFQ